MLKNQHGQNLYKQAGVDAQKGDALVDWLHSSSEKVVNPTGEAVCGIGGFAALFRPNLKSVKDPLIVSSTDGVGTKVLLGLESGRLDGLGVDLVAMCVNDLYTIGARPMFFLDYYASGKLVEADFRAVLTGIKLGCRQARMTLIGGETAELPGLYSKRHFDLAGFVVGLVDGETRLGPHQVISDDLLYALTSSGFHSNGYSLIRKWLENHPNKESEKKSLVAKLMTPTRIYSEVPEILDILGKGCIHALANITGGGISGNLPRVLPPELIGHVSINALPTQKWMKDFILERAQSLQAVEEVFNLGAGMIAVVGRDSKEVFERHCAKAALEVVLVGDVKPKQAGEVDVIFH